MASLHRGRLPVVAAPRSWFSRFICENTARPRPSRCQRNEQRRRDFGSKAFDSGLVVMSLASAALIGEHYVGVKSALKCAAA